MRPSTEQIIKTVETLSGLPVHMAEDASLQVDASIRIGTVAKPVHLLRYRPMKAGGNRSRPGETAAVFPRAGR